MIRVQNEYKGGTSDYVFGGDKARTLKAGDVGWISEVEWGTIPMGLRGPGGINPIQEDGELGVTMLDYYLPVGDSSNELRYQGSAPQGADPAESVWEIQQYTYADSGGGDFRVIEVQTLQNVPWGTDTASRDALAWT